MNETTTSQAYATARRKKGLLHIGLRLRAALVHRHFRQGSTLLDVGAADGAMIALLSKQVKFSLAVSLEKDATLAALIPEHGVCGSGTALPFGDNTFDCVICSATRKHVRDSAALMREIARVLKPAGRAVVIDPHPFLLWVGRWIGKFDPRYLFHLSSADDVAREMKAAGLKAVSRSTNIFISCVGEKQAERVLENP